MKNCFKWMLMLVAAISLAGCSDSDDSTTPEDVPGKPDDKPSTTVLTISQAAAAEDGTKVEIGESTIVAMSTKSLILKDKSGYMQIWFAEDLGLKVGNTLTLSGTVQTKNGLKSIAAGAEISPIDTDTPTFTQPVAKELTDAMIDAGPAIKYVTYTGTVQEGGYIVADNHAAKFKVHIQDPLSHLTLTTGTKFTVEGYTAGVTATTLELVAVLSEEYSDAPYRVWLRDENSALATDFRDDAALKFPAEGGKHYMKKLFIYVDDSDGIAPQPEVSCDHNAVVYEFEMDGTDKTFIVDENGSSYPHYTLHVTMPANTSTEPVKANLTVKIGDVVKNCPIEQDGKIDGVAVLRPLVDVFGQVKITENVAYTVFPAQNSSEEDITFTFTTPSTANNNEKKTTRWYKGTGSGMLILYPGDSFTINSKSGKAVFKKIEFFTYNENEITADKGKLEIGISTSYSYMGSDYTRIPLVWTGSEKSITFTAQGDTAYSWDTIRVTYAVEK